MSNNTVQSVYEVIKFDAVGSAIVYRATPNWNNNQQNKNNFYPSGYTVEQVYFEGISVHGFLGLSMYREHL